jgi:hypothetical protein
MKSVEPEVFIENTLSLLMLVHGYASPFNYFVFRLLFFFLQVVFFIENNINKCWVISASHHSFFLKIYHL